MIRYAIYFTPTEDATLWKFGCAAIGYDSAVGSKVPFHAHNFYRNSKIENWTADPRRYGFHATLKPPFMLAEGQTLEGLESAATAFCAGKEAFSVAQLKVAAIGSFVALIPAGPSPKLNQLAADCVTEFEIFRAPLSAADRARRLQSSLSEKQLSYLDAWGYPYVFDEFRFHMTLTGRLPNAVQAEALNALQELYAPLSQPIDIDSIGICVQSAREADFKVYKSFKFGG